MAGEGYAGLAHGEVGFVCAGDADFLGFVGVHGVGHDIAFKTELAQHPGGDELAFNIIHRQHHRLQRRHMQALPEGVVFGIGKDHVPAFLLVLFHFRRVGVQAHDFGFVGLKPVVRGGAGAAHTHHQYAGIAQGNRLFVRVSFLALEADDAWCQLFEQAVGKPVQGCGDHEGQRHGNGQRNQPFRQGDAGDNQAEFAVVGQRQGGQETAAGTQAEAQQQEVEQYAFERQQQGGDDCKDQGLLVWQAANTDLQEETHQEDFLHAPQGLGQFLGAGVVGQHGTEHQGAQFRTQAHRLETQATDHQGQQ